MRVLLILSLAISFSVSAEKKKWVPQYKKQLDSQKSLVLEKPIPKKSTIKPANDLERLYLQVPKGKAHLAKLKLETLKLKQDAVPTLVKVMKHSDYPDQNRWIATYMLGRIMGHKSAPFISKFSQHPNWMLRLASLKVLLHLEQKQYVGIYTRLLEDDSLIVRHQALQNIREMKLVSLAPYVWKMLYNQNNYVGVKGSRKRSHIIKMAIKVIGELEFKEAKMPMLKMIQKGKYADIHTELDYSLSLIEGKKSPKGNLAVKRHFWNKVAIKDFKL